MCIQCMAGAMAAVAAATGSRSMLAAVLTRWMTPRRKRVASALLITAGVLAGGFVGPSP